MKAIHMHYRPKKKNRRQEEEFPSVVCSPFVHLNSMNTYSQPPCPESSDTAVAYSKGKLSAMPGAPWD